MLKLGRLILRFADFKGEIIFESLLEHEPEQNQPPMTLAKGALN